MPRRCSQTADISFTCIPAYKDVDKTLHHENHLIRHRTSAYASIRHHTSAYVRRRRWRHLRYSVREVKRCALTQGSVPVKGHDNRSKDDRVAERRTRNHGNAAHSFLSVCIGTKISNFRYYNISRYSERRLRVYCWGSVCVLRPPSIHVI
jgi:hypothetical protein